jgi:hypothetical protein
LAGSEPAEPGAERASDPAAAREAAPGPAEGASPRLRQAAPNACEDIVHHNLPHKLRTNLGTLCRHTILTTSFLGWGHLKNGELLRAAEETGIDIFVTGDRTLKYEQNLGGRRLAIVVLSTNNWPIVRDHVSRILAAIDNARPGSCDTVGCGTFIRKRTDNR